MKVTWRVSEKNSGSLVGVQLAKSADRACQWVAERRGVDRLRLVATRLDAPIADELAVVR